MKSLFTAVIVVVVLGVMAYFTKPSDEKCKEVAAPKVKEQMLKDNSGAKYKLIDALATASSEKLIRIEDNVFFKRIFAGQRSIGWAAFGLVHVNAEN